MNRKWYNFETMFTRIAEKFHNFLQENNYKHEISGIGDGFHFEVSLSESEKKQVDGFLMQI